MRCPLCGAREGWTRRPPIDAKEIPQFLKRLAKLSRDLRKLSPEEVARQLHPMFLPLALETIQAITEWRNELAAEIERKEGHQ